MARGEHLKTVNILAIPFDDISRTDIKQGLNVLNSLFSHFLLWQSAMDAARLSAAKSSPMMETINMVRRIIKSILMMHYLHSKWVIT